MAVVPVCYKLPYKDHVFPCQNSPFVKGSIYSIAKKPSATHLLIKTKIGDIICASKGASILNLTQSPFLQRVWNTKGENLGVESQTSTTENQLELLDSYFGQLNDNTNHPSSKAPVEDESKAISTLEEFESLSSYLGKVNEATNFKNYKSNNGDNQTGEQKSASAFSDSMKGDGEKVKRFAYFRTKKVNATSSTSSQIVDQNDETADLYLIGLLVSINIGVFLFEIASPVRNSELELFSLPLLYGAKINDLILVGEWWRLVTPMFLHSGIFHVGLGCWSLVTFGPQVCRAYGSFAFSLIYILGGISGNLTSFLHTSEPTVGGTGPIFGIIGAWLVYQMQNRDVIGKDVTDSLYQKAIIITGLCFILSHFGPIDDWTHLGAVITGIAFGFMASPSVKLGNPSASSASSRGQEEGIAVLKEIGSPCKSVAAFAVCILVLSSLLVFVEPPLDNPLPDEFDPLALLS